MSIEKSLVIVKPDGVVRGLVGEIISRFEQRGLKIVGLKLVHAKKNFAEQHYAEDIEKKYGKKIRENLLRYITEGPVVTICVEGVHAVNCVRKIVGSTYPHEAQVGTIRGDFAHISKDYANAKGIDVRNLVHASGNNEEAEKEIKLWFDKSEIYSYSLANEKHIL